MDENENRLQTAVEQAEFAFWQSIADSYPEIQTGDVQPEQVFKFADVCLCIVKNWVENNMPKQQTTDRQTD